MKKITKVMLITAGVFGVLGIGFSVSGAAMGATVDSLELLRDFRDKVNTRLISDEGFHDDDYYDDEYDDDEDRAASGSANEALGTTEDGVRSYTLKDVTKLDAELTWDAFVMESWDKSDFGVEIQGDEREEISVVQQGNEVKLVSKKYKKEKQKENQRTVTFYYPKNSKFREVDIEIGAGTAELMDAIETDEFSFTVGAGEGNAYDRITAGEISLEVGLGALELDVLDGQNIDGECGMGSLNAIFTGSQSEYFVKAEGGLSSIVIGGSQISGIAGENTLGSKGASRTAELECGMGSINIEFEEE